MRRIMSLGVRPVRRGALAVVFGGSAARVVRRRGVGPDDRGQRQAQHAGWYQERRRDPGQRRQRQIAAMVGKDKLFGDDGADALCGEYGDDTYEGGIGSDMLSGFCMEELEFIGDFSGDDVMKGNEGSDFIAGGVGDDTLRGGKGILVPKENRTVDERGEAGFLRHPGRRERMWPRARRTYPRVPVGSCQPVTLIGGASLPEEA